MYLKLFAYAMLCMGFSNGLPDSADCKLSLVTCACMACCDGFQQPVEFATGLRSSIK